MLVRLFIVVLLAFSLVGMRATGTVESAFAVEMLEIIDAESGLEGNEATMTRELAVCGPAHHQSVLVPPSAELARSSPDPGGVFRPPRSLGS